MAYRELNIDTKKLESMINDGISANQCSKYFKVHTITICKRLNCMGYVYNDEDKKWNKVN